MRITESKKITDFFGCNVFSEKVMRQYLDEEAFDDLKDVIDNGKPLDKELAGKVAAAMKEWAVKIGATHFTHWFQPLTGTTAEKHDSFISLDCEGNPTLEFTGSNLRKGETDASSFPSGGMRATFEARGYTAWDCSSPAFVKKSSNGAGILYIPTVFCSYTGEALDKKTPLIKSMDELSKQSVRLLRLLGDEETVKVTANVGGEQEYFLIDKNDYRRREDIKFTGRTLFGAMPPKGQEKNDQYYASIKDRVSDFMADVNEELWKLGITAKTEHNEAAPAQHELAPIYCTANIATDQNQLIMETLKKVADDHGLSCLLHEKPFEGINGSGKHCNWSLNTDKGINLLKPGSDPASNNIFLLFFMAVVSAVDEYGDLLRMSASSLTNERRLGGNEAPPTVISVYIGEDLQNVLDGIASGHAPSAIRKQYIKTGVNYLAELRKDSSDRNRTSPFAFTGNKFEFRMVGSSATLSTPAAILNTVTAEMLSRICDMLEKSGESNSDKAVKDIVKELYSKHGRIIFNGNNYSPEWLKEAKRRGLENIDNCVDAYDCFIRAKNVELFEKHSVLSLKEIESRRSIYLENYVKSAHIETETMLMMTKREILPAVLKYQKILADEIISLNSIGKNYACVQEKLLERVTDLIERVDVAVEEINVYQNSAANNSDDTLKKAIIYRDQVYAATDKLRGAVDKLEEITPKGLWPYPTYADILFYE